MEIEPGSKKEAHLHVCISKQNRTWLDRLKKRFNRPISDIVDWIFNDQRVHDETGNVTQKKNR